MLQSLLARPNQTTAILAGCGFVCGAAYVLIAGYLSPVLLVAALVGLIGFGILVRYPLIGLYLTAAVVPLERMGRFVDDSSQVTISLMRVIGLAAVTALLINFFIRRKRPTIGLPLLLFGGYCLIAFASIWRSDDFVGSVRIFTSAVGHLLFFFLVVNLVESRRTALAAIVVWLLASGGAALYSTYDWHLGSGADGGIATDFDPGKGVQTTDNRFSTVWQDRAELETLDGLNLRRSMGTTSHAAVYGINLIMTIPFLLLILKVPPSAKWVLLACGSLVLTGYNIFLTNTRAAMILAVLVAGLCVWKRLFRLTRSFLIAGFVGTIVLLAVLPKDIYNRILDLSNYTFEESASLRIRVDYLDAGVRAWLDHPLFGIGVGNFHVIPEYFRGELMVPEETSVHNEYLQTLLEVGVVGAALFFTFVILLLRYAYRTAALFRRRNDLEGYWLMVACQVCMVAVLIYGAQVDVFHFPLQGWWLVAGVTYAMYRLARREQEAMRR